MNLLSRVVKSLSYLISPPYCEYCKKFIKNRAIFCDDCFNKIKPIVSSNIILNTQYNLKILAIADYQGPIKSLILGKMSSNYLSSLQIGELIWNYTNLKHLDIDFLIPIPLHWKRYIKRGYNQTNVISSVLAKKSGKQIADILIRRKNTAFQSSLQLQERIENVKNAFEINAKNLNIYENKNLIIVDDLLTSGSTIISAAKILTKLKPKSITVVVACRVV